jgi:nucleoside-diphosphate-sugar epimerase
MMSVLVVGATGATGKHVVQQLLDQGNSVKVIVRSKERMMDAIKTNQERLTITEASLLDLSDEEIKEQVKGTQAVVSCLGHTMDFKGMFRHPRKLVTDSVKRLTTAMDSDQKFVLMGSDGVAHPAGTDDRRSFSERTILCLLRYLIPPHADNEAAADYIHSVKNLEWVVVRPTDLVDGEVSEYELFDKPQGSLFGGGQSTRSNVAKVMVDLLSDEKLWETYKFNMPVTHDAKK